MLTMQSFLVGAFPHQMGRLPPKFAGLVAFLCSALTNFQNYLLGCQLLKFRGLFHQGTIEGLESSRRSHYLSYRECLPSQMPLWSLVVLGIADGQYIPKILAIAVEYALITKGGPSACSDLSHERMSIFTSISAAHAVQASFILSG